MVAPVEKVNPVGFVGNLVSAGKMGFMGFASKFLTYLKASLISWLTGAMSGSGVYVPQGFTIKEILKFILSVLGLTWANLRVKLVKAVGETAVKAMEKGFELVKTRSGSSRRPCNCRDCGFAVSCLGLLILALLKDHAPDA